MIFSYIIVNEMKIVGGYNDVEIGEFSQSHLQSGEGFLNNMVRKLNVKKIVKLLDKHFVIVDNSGQFERGKLRI